MRRLSPARLPIALIALALATRAGARPAHAGERLRYDLRGELGGEYDSNVHRTEIIEGAANPAVVGSPLARAAVSGQLADVIADRQQITLAATLAGKLFGASQARDEDVALASSSGRWRLALNADTGLAVQGLYYEAFQRASSDPAAADDRRDFRSMTPALQIDRRISDSVVLIAGGGYRWFVFKSDLDFNFQGPLATLDLRWTGESADGNTDWELTGGAGVERRAFAGSAVTIASVPPTPRRDTFVLGHVELTRVGKLLLGAGYALQWNDSNSYGDALTRHVFTARLATPLPFACYLAARAELILALYRDTVTLGTAQTTGALLSIDDENRSSLRVDLSRALSDRLLLLARYTLYANELGVSAPVASYWRQTILLSLAFTFEH
jgi:hypothetical protein